MQKVQTCVGSFWYSISANFITGFLQNQWPHSISGPVESLYLKMSGLNRCIHRDYQSIAVNGARSSNMQETMFGLARNRTLDYPMIVVLALVGNDVCNG